MKTTLTTIIAAAFALGFVTSASAAYQGKGPLEFNSPNQIAPRAATQNPTLCGHNAMKCSASKTASCCHHAGTTQADACHMSVTVKHLGGADKGLILLG